MMADSRPIGIFDSGVGGLTVLQALRQRFPAESFLYLGDTARLPYGSKSASTVQRYALNAAAHLVAHDVKLLVVACNTASSYALDAISASAPVPVVGVVEPGVRAALARGNRRIGIIGTEGTVASQAYQKTLLRTAPNTKIRAAACPLFVPLAEEGWGDHPITEQIARHYLDELLHWGVETLILGCTHYPLLIPSLARAVPGVALVDSASAVAEAVAEDHHELVNLAAHGEAAVKLQLSDASERFLRITHAILGEAPASVEVVDVKAVTPPSS